MLKWINIFDKINPGASSNVGFRFKYGINIEIFSLKCFCKYIATLLVQPTHSE